ncbi:MAG: VCBS repeat-containing protein, partial [Fuerstiella sp.]|nr:VCBS repeat-containing protein [Fuerstiella sp.]
MTVAPITFHACTSATVLIAFAVLLPGCTKDSSSGNSLPASNDAATVESRGTAAESGPPSETTVPGVSNQPDVAADDTQPAASQLPVIGEFPSALFIDHEGDKVGRRDLHGSVCLVQIFAEADDATAQQHSDVLKDLSEKLSSTSNWKYTLIVDLFLDTDVTESMLKNLADNGSRNSDEHRLYWAPADEFDESDSGLTQLRNTVILIDPVGRIRGAYDDVSVLEKAIEQLWQEQVPFLHEVLHTTWMEARRDTQMEQISQIPVQHDFQFKDVRKKSGIRFLHQIVDDAGSDYKGVHYDHGNGVTIADVDGDELMDVYFVNQLGENELYRNRGDGTFEDITSTAGVAVGDRVCVAASFVDVDNDGDADLYVTAVR